jgi:thiamine biosynthesis lipoprotein
MKKKMQRAAHLNKRTNGLIAGLICIVLIAGCAPKRPKNRGLAVPPIAEFWSVMSTDASVAVAATHSNSLAQYVDTTKTIFTRVNAEISTFNPTSYISRINSNISGEPIPVSADTYRVLESSKKYSEISKGCFDVTTSPLVDLWGFGRKGALRSLPDKTAIKLALSKMGYEHIKLSSESSSVYLDKPGMSINLGGIGKGFAVDLAYDELRARDAKNFLVNLSGNVRCSGDARSSVPHWNIGVKHPFGEKVLIGNIVLKDGMALATSGNYEKYAMIDGVRYTHIIDPATGGPVKDMAAVTVVTTSATEADAMSTAIFVLGVERAKAVLASMKHCEALMVEDKRPLRLWVTPGMKKLFQPYAASEGKIHLISTYRPETTPE